MTPQQRRSWHDRLRAGVRAGIADALEEHRRAGRKVPIWRDGKVVWMNVPKPARGTAARKRRSA